MDTPAYSETVELLSHLAPEEILLHGSACQGSSKSLLCRKIEKWRETFEGHPIIKPITRAYFDQDRGAEFLRRVSLSQIDSEIMARYTVLGATFALLKYIETTASMTFPRRSVKLNFVDNSAGDFLIIDRRTSNCLEILNNARSGDQKNCLFGKIDRTKVSSTLLFICFQCSCCLKYSNELTIIIITYIAYTRLLVGHVYFDSNYFGQVLMLPLLLLARYVA